MEQKMSAQEYLNQSGETTTAALKLLNDIFNDHSSSYSRKRKQSSTSSYDDTSNDTEQQPISNNKNTIRKLNVRISELEQKLEERNTTHEEYTNILMDYKLLEDKYAKTTKLLDKQREQNKYYERLVFLLHQIYIIIIVVVYQYL